MTSALHFVSLTRNAVHLAVGAVDALRDVGANLVDKLLPIVHVADLKFACQRRIVDVRREDLYM